MTRAEAARHNGAQSQGPTTPEGKQTSSQNALKHGLNSARIIVLPNEDQAAYDQLLFDYERQYQPQGHLEIDLVHEIAASRWRLARCVRLEAAAMKRALAEAAPGTDAETAILDGTMGPQGILRQLSRYEARLRRSYEKATSELRRIQAERLALGESKLESGKKRAGQFEPKGHFESYLAAIQTERTQGPNRAAIEIAAQHPRAATHSLVLAEASNT